LESTDHERVSDGRAMHLPHVLEPPSGEPNLTLGDEVFLEEQDQIHIRYDPRRMDIAVRKNGEVTVVDFKGRLAIGVSDSLLPGVISDILKEGNKKILLNLSEMDYIDSNGLGELVQAFRESQRKGASLRLLKPQDRVAKTLRLTNLLPMFEVYESEDDAIRAFGA
jgi:anti-anti-sigma factor